MTQQHGGVPRDADQPAPIDISPDDAPRTAAVGDLRWRDDDARATADRTGREPPEDASTGSSLARVVLLGALLAVGVAGAGVLGTAAWRVAQQKDATLDPPASAAGLTRDDGSGAAETAEYLRTALAARVDLDRTTAAVYLDPADDARSVLFFGGTALLFSPGSELDGALELVDDQGGVRNLREVPVGDLGGVMKCGALDNAEGALAVCGWADHGSVALAMFQGRTPEEAGPLMRGLRNAIQHRS